MTKIYECAICKRLAKRGIKGHERFRGIRKEVRKHLVEVHHVKGTTSLKGADGKSIERSSVTSSIISEEAR